MSKENTNHEYISSKQDVHSAWFRLSNYFVLLLILLFDSIFKIRIPDVVYMIIGSQVMTTDAYKIWSSVRRR